jgi:hypothetical protein
MHEITWELLNRFSLNLHLIFCLKFVDFFQIWLKSDSNNGHFSEALTCVSALVSQAWLAKYLSDRKFLLKNRWREKEGYTVYRIQFLQHEYTPGIVNLCVHFRTCSCEKYCHLFRSVTLDGAWIGYWIYWPLVYATPKITAPLLISKILNHNSTP